VAPLGNADGVLRPRVRVIDGELSPREFTLLSRWINLNRKTLIKYWENKIDTLDAYNVLKPLRVWKRIKYRRRRMSTWEFLLLLKQPRLTLWILLRNKILTLDPRLWRTSRPKPLVNRTACGTVGGVPRDPSASSPLARTIRRGSIVSRTETSSLVCRCV